MAAPGIYSGLRPSGADYGGIAERGIERLLREQRVDEDARVATAKQIRAEVDSREKFALEAMDDMAVIDQNTLFSEQILKLNEDTQNEMLKLTDKVIATGSFKDKMAIKSFNQQALQKAAMIGTFIKSIEDINAKFTTIGKDGNPEYSLNLNAAKQQLLAELMTGKGDYKLDFETLTVEDKDGNKQGAQQFLNNNFKDLKKYMDPNKAVDDFFSSVDFSTFSTMKEIQYLGKDGKEHSYKTWEGDYNEAKKSLYSEFSRMFNADNTPWQEYAAQYRVPEGQVTEKMFDSGLFRSKFIGKRTTEEIEPTRAEGGTVTERKAAKQRADTTNWLLDFASGGTAAGGESVLRDVSRTTEEGGMEKVYSVERFINPKTGKVGASIKTTTGKGEPQPPLIVADLATPQGAAEVLDMAVSKPRSTFAKYDDLDIDAQTLAQQVQQAQAQLPEARKQELIQKGLIVGVERSLDKAFADIGRTALAKQNIDQVVGNMFTELSNYLPDDVLERVKQRVGVVKTGLLAGKRKLVIDDQKFETLNVDTKKVIIDAIGEVIRDEFKSTTQPAKEVVDVSSIFN